MQKSANELDMVPFEMIPAVGSQNNVVDDGMKGQDLAFKFDLVSSNPYEENRKSNNNKNNILHLRSSFTTTKGNDILPRREKNNAIKGIPRPTPNFLGKREREEEMINELSISHN